MVIHYDNDSLKVEVVFSRNGNLKVLRVSIYERYWMFFWKHSVTWSFTVSHFRPAETRDFIDKTVEEYKILKNGVIG